jgi:hypothetical protein
VAQEAKADEVFLDLVTRFAREGRNASYKPGPTYAPAVFVKEDEARKAGISGKAFEAAMRAYSRRGKSGMNNTENHLARATGWRSKHRCQPPGHLGANPVPTPCHLSEVPSVPTPISIGVGTPHLCR